MRGLDVSEGRNDAVRKPKGGGPGRTQKDVGKNGETRQTKNQTESESNLGPWAHSAHGQKVRQPTGQKEERRRKCAKEKDVKPLRAVRENRSEDKKAVVQNLTSLGLKNNKTKTADQPGGQSTVDTPGVWEGDAKQGNGENHEKITGGGVRKNVGEPRGQGKVFQRGRGGRKTVESEERRFLGKRQGGGWVKTDLQKK